jgi:hypothetical protein
MYSDHHDSVRRSPCRSYSRTAGTLSGFTLSVHRVHPARFARAAASRISAPPTPRPRASGATATCITRASPPIFCQ